MLSVDESSQLAALAARVAREASRNESVLVR